MANNGLGSSAWSNLINIQSTTTVTALNVRIQMPCIRLFTIGLYSLAQQVIYWAFFSIAFSVTQFRLWIRWRKNKSLKLDDYFQILALCLLLVQTICATLAWPTMFEMMAINRGEAPFTISFALRTERWLGINFAAVICYFWCLWSVKMSFLCFFKPLLRSKRGLMRYWWAVLIFCCFLMIASNLMFVFLCGDPNRYLHPIFSKGCGSREDILRDYQIVPISVGLDIISDLLVMSIPYPILIQVKLPRRQKVLLTIIFSIALGIVAVSAIRVWKLMEQGDRKFPDPIALTTISEAQSIVAVVLCSVPPLRTLVLNRNAATDPQKDVEAQRKQLEEAKRKKPRFGLPTISLASFEMRAKAKYGSHRTGMFSSQRSGLFRSMVGVKTMPTIADVDIPSSGDGTQLGTLNSWDTVGLEKAGYGIMYESIDQTASSLSRDTASSSSLSSQEAREAMRSGSRRTNDLKSDASPISPGGASIADRRAQRTSTRAGMTSPTEKYTSPENVRQAEEGGPDPSDPASGPFVSTFSPPSRNSTPDPLPARKLRLDTIGASPAHTVAGTLSKHGKSSSVQSAQSAVSDNRFAGSQRSGPGSAFSVRTPDFDKSLPPLPGGDMSGGKDHLQYPYNPLYSPAPSTVTAHITSQRKSLGRSKSQHSRSTTNQSIETVAAEKHQPFTGRGRDPVLRRSRSDLSELLKKADKSKAKSYLVQPQPGINTVLAEDTTLPRSRHRSRSSSTPRLFRKYSSPPPHDPSQRNIYVRREVMIANTPVEADRVSSSNTSIVQPWSRGRTSGGGSSLMSGDGDEAMRQAREEYWARDIQRHEYEQQEQQRKKSGSVSPSAGRYEKYRAGSPQGSNERRRGFGNFGWRDIGARRIVNGKLVVGEAPANWPPGNIPAMGLQEEPKVRTWVGKGLSRMSAHDLRSVDEAVEEIWRREKEEGPKEGSRRLKSEDELLQESRIQAEVDRQAQRRAGRGAVVRELSLSRTRQGSRNRHMIAEADESEEERKESDVLLPAGGAVMDISEPFAPVSKSSETLGGQHRTDAPSAVILLRPARLSAQTESSFSSTSRSLDTASDTPDLRSADFPRPPPSTKIAQTIQAIQARANFRTKSRAKAPQTPKATSRSSDPTEPEPNRSAASLPPMGNSTPASPSQPQEIVVSRSLSHGAQRLRMEEARRTRGLWSPLHSPTSSAPELSSPASRRARSSSPAAAAERAMSTWSDSELAPPVPAVPEGKW